LPHQNCVRRASPPPTLPCELPQSSAASSSSDCGVPTVGANASSSAEGARTPSPGTRCGCPTGTCAAAWAVTPSGLDAAGPGRPCAATTPTGGPALARSPLLLPLPPMRTVVREADADEVADRQPCCDSQAIVRARMAVLAREEFPHLYVFEGPPLALVPPTCIFEEGLGADSSSSEDLEHFEDFASSRGDGRSECATPQCQRSRIGSRCSSQAGSNDTEGDPPFRLPPWLAPPAAAQARDSDQASASSLSGFSDVSDG